MQGVYQYPPLPPIISAIHCTALTIGLVYQEEQARREREMEALEANRLEVLEKLAASVPYAEACANAKAKLDHITGTKEPTNDKGNAIPPGLNVSHEFSPSLTTYSMSSSYVQCRPRARFCQRDLTARDTLKHMSPVHSLDVI